MQNVNDLPMQEQQKYFDKFERWIETEFNGDESTADEQLKAGYAIFYENDVNPDELIREYPDGRREVVQTVVSEDNSSFEIVVVREL
ncbi:hypothetical protein [Halodesulfovibrio spirochaetisodalis]|uniref:Uncharacterized protein n=1 Tax=Halodesulfovibrio spirochaetisodalis TaxID=1560234 RepID=A0A1B7XAZ0_9BACT|nr:hypothetical protein [Halodesulfovibrio spirochaetisodalis]OBQ46470.1 hypothetical protein SP90_12265 [Halodesulfovibrio spirochaetisodalis]